MSSRKKRNTCNYADEDKRFHTLLNDNAEFTLQQAYLAPKDLEGRENQPQSFK